MTSPSRPSPSRSSLRLAAASAAALLLSGTALIPASAESPAPAPRPTSTAAAHPAATQPAAVRAAAKGVRIADIQGTGDSTPMNGQTVTTEPAIVTAVYPAGPGSFGGFVIQAPGTGGQRDLAKGSDAIFVYTGTTQSTVKKGDRVQVTGVAGEYKGLTQLAGNIEVTPVSQKLAPIRPVTNPWASTAGHREALESMVYDSHEQFTVSDTYGLGKYGELGLSAGQGLPTQPTEVARPNTAEAAAQAAWNEAHSVTLDDGTNQGFAASPKQAPRQVPYMTPQRHVAVGDDARLTEPVIVDYRFDKWRFQPTSPVVPGSEPAAINHHDEALPGVGGQLRIASFNVLNYFTTTGDSRGCKGANWSTDGTYNVASGCDVRGAFDAADLARQQAKTVSALNQMDASVVGLMEVENSAKLGEPKDEALNTLVAALNKQAGYRKWAAAPVPADQLEPVSEQDFITAALIYQPAKARLVGQPRALGSQAGPGQPFADARTPIAGTFVSTQEKKARPTTVVVNHFKSKGSAPKSGPNADLGDGQGAWNADRVRQAQAVAAWVPQLTKAAGSEDVALLGDFNSYSQEDPMQVFYQAGYTEAGRGEHTYVFGGQVGSLDHMLLSPSLARRMTGSAAWNINSGQSPLLQYAQYRTTALDYYAADPYGSSDHDPFLAGFRSK